MRCGKKRSPPEGTVRKKKKLPLLQKPLLLPKWPPQKLLPKPPPKKPPLPKLLL